MTIELRKNDPIAMKALDGNDTTLTEIGFIPGDKFGCKIYACNNTKGLTVVGIHSRVYGCTKEQLEPVVIL